VITVTPFARAIKPLFVDRIRPSKILCVAERLIIVAAASGTSWSFGVLVPASGRGRYARATWKNGTVAGCFCRTARRNEAVHQSDDYGINRDAGGTTLLVNRSWAA